MAEYLINSRENAQRIARVESSFGGGNVFASLISNASLNTMMSKMSFSPVVPITLSGTSSTTGSLVAPGRVLIGEGVLVKSCRKQYKKRQFFLFNDILIYGTIVGSGGGPNLSSATSGGGGGSQSSSNRNRVSSQSARTPSVESVIGTRYVRPHVIPLEEIQMTSFDDERHSNTIVNNANGSVSNLVNHGGGGNSSKHQHNSPSSSTTFERKHGWVIKTRAKSFAVFAATEEEKRDWMVHIEKCVRDLLHRTGKVATSVHAPVWVPDAHATVCMVCQTSTFNLVNRRHHCRACGRVVCRSCSSHRRLIPNIDAMQSIRVCSDCYYGGDSGEMVAGGGEGNTMISSVVSRREGDRNSLSSTLTSNRLSGISETFSAMSKEGKDLTDDHPNPVDGNSRPAGEETGSSASESDDEDKEVNVDADGDKEEVTSFYGLPAMLAQDDSAVVNDSNNSNNGADIASEKTKD